MSTTIGTNSPQTVKAWSTALAVAVAKESYWARKFTGLGVRTEQPVMQLNELERNSGDTIKFDINWLVGGPPTEGDKKVEGSGAELRFAQDEIHIDQQRKAFDCGGEMSRQRTLHNLREIGRDQGKQYMSRLIDEDHFMYAAAARGINPGFIQPLSYTGRAGNAFQAPDAEHLLYGDGTSKATLTSAGVMTRTVIERANTRADTQGGGAEDLAELQPIRINGNLHRVCVMHPYQFHSLKTSTGTNDWMDIYKALTTAEGKNNPIFMGGEGMIGGTILHTHKSVIRFNDYGSGGNLPAARALYLGRQALTIAFGKAGKGSNGLKMLWSEKELDHGNALEIAVGATWAVKKTRFGGKDFGMFSIDTYAADPG